MATFIQIRRMLQLAAPVIALFLFISDSAEGAGTAMESALPTSNFDSVGRDRIWIGQQSLALPVSKVPCRREPRLSPASSIVAIVLCPRIYYSLFLATPHLSS